MTHRQQRIPKNVPFLLSSSHVRYHFEIVTIASMSCVKISCQCVQASGIVSDVIAESTLIPSNWWMPKKNINK